MGIGYRLDAALSGLGVRMLRSRGMFRGWFARWRTRFDVLERAGLHVLPVHYLSPVPDTRTLSPKLWETHTQAVGLDLGESRGLELLPKLAQYRAEFERFPIEMGSDPKQYFYRNNAYGPGEAEVLYGMVRLLKPKRFIEIGSGFTTLVTAAAVVANEKEGHPCEFVAIEPYPKDLLRQKIPGLSKLIEKPLQEVPLEQFSKLELNDVLFIDSTHCVRIGSDVCYEFLEILPRIGTGAYIHVHDIFLPAEYPKDWIFKSRFFWNEQYLVQAFLAFNKSFEVVWPGHLMHLRHAEKLKAAFPAYAAALLHPPANFWMWRVGGGG